MQAKKFTPKKIILIVSVLVLVGLVLGFLYFFFLHPIVSHFFVPSWVYQDGIHNGLEYYANNKYVEFESGDKFEQLLCSTDYVSSGEVIGFYHTDNFYKDNPILYGKMCDVFAIDIQLNAATFSSMQFDDADFCNNMDDFKLYLLSEYTCESTRDTALIAACDQAKIIRIILITDAEQYEFKSDYGSVLTKQAFLEWDLTT